ncbi:MAG TPA: sugar phosphate isomerase/epimerase family protein [Methanoregulaceae archaeon]|nr:sugar phosphate isomerase/epimerase family protein [Methanoregulaceae archaeon]HQJ88010.1 sugar phosphate isomerase/epimerase family protein [Methanoregulaceae archaeon]
MGTAFGISSFCLHDRPLSEALERLSELTRVVEVMDEGCHRLHDTELLETFDLEYTIHAPSRGVNLASLLEPVRRASVEVTIGCFSLAARVGAGVVVHPGYCAWAHERTEAWGQFRRSLQELKAGASDLSIPFYVENMGDWGYFLLKTPDELPLIEDAGFALDVGHAHQNHALEGFLQARFDHVHLHDNDGTTDAHAPVGEGTIDFAAVMEVVQRNGARPIIEVGTLEGVVSSLRALEGL